MSDSLLLVQRCTFVLTVLLEVVALLRAARCRAGFDPSDPGRRIWNLFSWSLGLRVLAELRLSTIYFNLIPDAITTSEQASFVYVVVLRYIYSLSDVFLVAALLVAIASYRSLGLQFRLQRGDLAMMTAAASLPVISFSLRQQLTGFLGADDPTIAVYRLVAVSLASVSVLLAVVMLRYVRQMGRGILSRMWAAIVVAVFARAGSFVVLALVASWSTAWANVAEQLALLLFALAWIAATHYQRSLQSFRADTAASD